MSWMILFKKQLFDLEVKSQGPMKIIMVHDTPYYGHAPTYQISLTYLERQKKLWSGDASLRRSGRKKQTKTICLPLFDMWYIINKQATSAPKGPSTYICNYKIIFSVHLSPVIQTNLVDNGKLRKTSLKLCHIWWFFKMKLFKCVFHAWSLSACDLDRWLKSWKLACWYCNLKKYTLHPRLKQNNTFNSIKSLPTSMVPPTQFSIWPTVY